MSTTVFNKGTDFFGGLVLLPPPFELRVEQDPDKRRYIDVSRGNREALGRARRDQPTMVMSWASLTPFSHLGDRLASIMRRLYFFSNRSCCWTVSSLKLGGHTFRALYGLLTTDNGALRSRGPFADAAIRRKSVGNIAIG